MDIPTYQDTPEFVASVSASSKTQIVDVKDTAKQVIGRDASLATIVQSFITAQSQTTHSLIEYIGKAVASSAGDVTIGEKVLNTAKQQEFLTENAWKQNLMSRHLKKNVINK